MTDFAGPARFNHVAMSMAPDALDEANEAAGSLAAPKPMMKARLKHA